jgi:hypothetical protein
MPRFQDLTVAELKAKCKERGIRRYSTLTKSELISRLRKCSSAKKSSKKYSNCRSNKKLSKLRRAEVTAKAAATRAANKAAKAAEAVEEEEAKADE